MNLCPELGVPLCNNFRVSKSSLTRLVQHLPSLPLPALLGSRPCISLFGTLESACRATWPSHLSL